MPSPFTNIRIFPHHGSRTAIVTWDLPDSMLDGEVDVAFSLTAAADSWILKTDAPVAASDKQFTDTTFLIQAGVPIGYYALHWTRGDESFLSGPIGIFNDMSRREYGITKAVLLREFLVMRATNGFPVFHFIARTDGAFADNTDPDTEEVMGEECAGAANPSFDKTFKGGFYPPTLTWIRPLSATRGNQTDRADDTGSTEDVGMRAVMLAFPQPMRWHMLVDPVTDRRYIITEVVTSALRANVPNAYQVKLDMLQTSHPAYRIDVPRDVSEWRQIKPYFIP